jgi:hypothetical protein
MAELRLEAVVSVALSENLVRPLVVVLQRRLLLLLLVFLNSKFELTGENVARGIFEKFSLFGMIMIELDLTVVGSSSSSAVVVGVGVGAGVAVFSCFKLILVELLNDWDLRGFN